MSGYYWQLPLTNNFPFEFEHRVYIQPRPTPPWRRRPQLDSYLQDQYELSQPASGPDPYAHVQLSNTQASGWHQTISEPSQSLRRGAKLALEITVSMLLALKFCFLEQPFMAISNVLTTVDWWMVGAFFFAVFLSPLTAPEELSRDEPALRLATNLEYVLVDDIRRWGELKQTGKL